MNVERFYSFDEIRENVNCLEYAKQFLGMTKSINGSSDKHFDNPWRPGSDSGAFFINSTGWYDFVSGEFGFVIDLVAKTKFSGNLQEAQQEIGDNMNLKPVETLQVENRKTRLDFQIEKGYKVTKTYNYTDEKGVVKHIVHRLEHPKMKKEFIQEMADGSRVKDSKTYLYNFPNVLKSSYIGICEGEKDADTLNSIGFCATTNASGSSGWKDEYNEYLKDKDIIIFQDNDDAGRNRTSFFLWSFREIAKTLRVWTNPEMEKGSDITDWIEKNSKDEFFKRLKLIQEIDKKAIKKPNEDYVAICEAKKANTRDFQNYWNVEIEGKLQKKPRQINDMIEDVNKRFLGFPCKVGDRLFDHNRKTGEIEYINNTNALFSWICRKSNKHVDFSNCYGALSKAEFFESINSTSMRYESISYVPDYPSREDTYYAHEAMPVPSTDHSAFDGLIDFFNPANDSYRILLKAFFASPLFFKIGVKRPAWVIDSKHGAGTGKTTIVECLANLYGNRGTGSPIKTTKKELTNNFDEVIKRIVSPEGRQKRVFLLDNVQGNFISPEFADLVTMQSVSGRAPYGKGEETRPNNLIYCITANCANIDSDTASRSFFIFLKKSTYTTGWAEKLMQYITINQLQIISDIIDILKNSNPMTETASRRFPEFETQVLQPMCESFDDYNEVIKQIIDDTSTANVEEDFCRQVEDELRSALISLDLKPYQQKIFIHTAAVKEFLSDISKDIYSGGIIEAIRNQGNMNNLPCIDSKINRWPQTSSKRRRGIMWLPEDLQKQPIPVVAKIGKQIKIIDRISE